MAASKSNKKQKRKISRNVPGVFSKAHRYALLGVPVATYIYYPDKDELLYFESDDFSNIQIEEKKKSARAIRYLPKDVERLINKHTAVPKKRGDEKNNHQYQLKKFPSPPDFDIFSLKRS